MEFQIQAAPYRIETERLVLRCPEVADVSAIHDGVGETVETLRPWMPWVGREGFPLSERAEQIRELRAGFDRGKDFTYMVFRPDNGEFIGGMGIHPRVGVGGVELGYWIRAREQGRGLAGEGGSALIRTAFEQVGADRVEIRIELENAASHRVVEKLQVPLEATLRRRFPRDGDMRDIHVFTVFRKEFPGSPAASVPVRYFNSVGQPVRPRSPIQP